jgi:radical SAM protein with 4Fe4S-binding SPASM domain
MIQIHYDIFANFWYHLLAQLAVSEPYAVYNPEYIINNELIIPENIKTFLVNNLANLSHFPFYSEMTFNEFTDKLRSYIDNFPDKEKAIVEFQIIEDDLFIFIDAEYKNYTQRWQPEMVINELDAFKNRDIDKFIHALKFFSYITDIEFAEDLHVWLIKAMPDRRGKSIGFPSRSGFAITVPKNEVLSDDTYFIGVHELAHYFTDRLLMQEGLDLSMERNSEAYIRREALAEFVTEMYFKDIGKPMSSLWQMEFIPRNIENRIIERSQKLVSGIEITHFGNYSREFPIDLLAQVEIVKDIYFIEKRNERLYFFLPLIGRMVGVPIRFFKKLSPIEFDEVYAVHFIKAGLLVKKGYKYFRQSTEDLPRCNSFVKKVRFHMTNRCNLRCKYCYLSAGESNCFPAGEVGEVVEISAEKAKNYLNVLYGDDLNGIEVEFHGGGEPTLMIEEIKEIVAYIDKNSEQRTIRLQTNGVFSQNTADWIVDNKIFVSFSIDGAKEITDTQRTEGTDAFERIIANIKQLVERGVNVSTVSVITEYSQDKLNDIYEFIKTLGIKAMMMNPVHSFLGRSQKHDHPAKRDVDLTTFVNNFLTIKNKADKEGIYLISDFLPDFYQYVPRNYQCDACKAGVAIFGNGDVCACTRAYDLGQGSSNPFVWANVNNEVKVDVENEERLRTRVAENMQECNHCLLKWNCAGDCLLQCYEINGDMYKVYNDRCKAKKQYIVEYLKGLIPSNKEYFVALLHFPAVTPMLPPPGVNFLANYLIESGASCEVIDINKDMYFNYKGNWSKTFTFQYNYLNDILFKEFIDDYFNRILSLISERSYKYIGISCFENTFDIINIFLEKLKENNMHNIFLGGPDVFMEVEKYKDFIRTNHADAIILKEGEHKVRAYISGEREIRGVITKNNINDNFNNYKDETFLNLNSELPLLNQVSGYVDGKFAHQVMPICASRGCSSNCSFCSHKILWEGYRLRNVDDVITEMLFHKQNHGCNLFYFTDMLLNGSSVWLKEFVDKLSVLQDKMYWSAYVRIDSTLYESFCNKLTKAGAVYLSFGIESNSQRVLDAANKGTKVDDNEMVISNVSKVGIFIHASFIIGLPEENIDDLVMTLDYIKRKIWDIDHVEIFFFENLPQASGYEASNEYFEKNSDKDRYKLKKQLYDELIVKFNQIGAGFLSSRQLYSSESAVFKKALNEFYRRKYTGEKQSGEEDFLEKAEKIHQFKLEQIKLLDDYIKRFTS